ncbi:GDSL esterase/lipase At5g03610-like [Cucurbita moschata]|uniref:GDSL esterase/lipase At5g03610-like n=1 Tax=Cucurbita moschata TaxID=3662 RepID=A0A6J1EJR0_CUCMO|nr:GDSL esterase/lipase At5g03610-like [Cucurbita moschata]
MHFVLRLLFPLFLSISLFSGRVSAGGVYNHHLRHRFRPTKLFVFGDSYTDTGNILFPISPGLQFPYGITFPGKPIGRFSDGRVLTDFAGKQICVSVSVSLFRRFSDRPVLTKNKWLSKEALK